MSQVPTIVRRLQFCMGHRVYGHESKCKSLHGHNYVAYIHARANSLDELGRVIDFSIVKQLAGTWIDKYWDHGTVLWKDDPLTVLWVGHDAPLHTHKVSLLDENPTAENLATNLLKICGVLFKDEDIEVFRVDLQETENCSATARLDA